MVQLLVTSCVYLKSSVLIANNNGNSDTSTSELNHVEPRENNLKLNCAKSKEIIFTSCGLWDVQ